jgi:hypothetical protein
MNTQITEGLDNFTFYGTLLTTFKDILSLANKEALGLANSISGSLRNSIVENNLRNLEKSKEALDLNREKL